MKGSAFPRALIEDLKCPFCDSGLRPVAEVAASESGIEHGVLRCDCYEYPVVRGIPVLRRIGPAWSRENQAVDRLRANDPVGAHEWLLGAGRAPGLPGPTPSRRSQVRTTAQRWLDQARRMILASPDTGERDRDDFRAALVKGRPKPYADYLYHRFANPSILAAIPALAILGDHRQKSGRRRFLEILCGIGHLSATADVVCPSAEIVMTDVDYTNLAIARRFVTPGTVAICLDAEMPLPFRDDAFDGLYCLDGLHYVGSKTRLLGEVDRVVTGDGAWVFAHMHNALGTNPAAGIPLSAQGYASRFAFGEHRLVPERGLLDQIRRDGFVDLTTPPDPVAVEASNALILFGARDGSLWRRHDRFDDVVAGRPDRLWFNPLYVLERTAGGLTATARWPTQALRAECTADGPLVPESIDLPDRLVEEIIAAGRDGALSAGVRELVRSFVLVCLPDCYRRTDLPQ
jgi:SAM-dependent methyltransferase